MPVRSHLLRWVVDVRLPGGARALGGGHRVRLAPPRRRVPVQRGPDRVQPRARPRRGRRSGRSIREYQVEHSTALHATIADERGRERHFQTGPLARWMNNADVVPDSVRSFADEIGVAEVETNPFRSILVRGLEVLWAVEESQRIIGAYRPPASPFGPCAPAGRCRPRVHRGAPRNPLPPLRDRRRRAHRRRRDHPADVAEPGRDRARPARLRRLSPGPRRPRARSPVRAGDSELRPVHLVCHALPALRDRPEPEDRRLSDPTILDRRGESRPW